MPYLVSVALSAPVPVPIGGPVNRWLPLRFVFDGSVHVVGGDSWEEFLARVQSREGRFLTYHHIPWIGITPSR